MGNYGYLSAKPHAVTRVDNTDYLKASASRQTTYNAFAKAALIVEGDSSQVLFYGPDKTRWLQATDHYYLLTDNVGSVTHIVSGEGGTKFEAGYEAWGRQHVTKNDIGFFRGYGGHEMLPQYRLVNMDGRLYDYALGRFLSPDNYVQEPGNSQNFNRYSYCLNNPLKYTDPDGEWYHIVIGALVGGVTNLYANWKNCNGIWEYLSAFSAGAAAGGLVAASAGAGAGAGAGSIIGVSASTGAATAATNSIIAQTDKNFKGIENVDWLSIGKNAVIGGMAGAAGGATGYYISGSSLLVNNVNSPILRSAVVSSISSAAGHVAGGTAAGMLEGHSFHTSLNNSFDNFWQDVALGGAIGVASTIGTCYANNVNPWTGNKQYRITFGQNDNQTYHTFRHTDKLNLPRKEVMKNVTKDIQQLTIIPYGMHVNRTIIINGIRLQYTVFKLNNGTLNVGRIHEIK